MIRGLLDKGQSAHERDNDSSIEESKYLALVQYIQSTLDITNLMF